MFWRRKNNKWFIGEKRDYKKYYKEYMKNYMKKSEVKERLKKNRQKPENKKKWDIRQLTRKYILIPKEQICEICKINKATERHHIDYNKPLKVIFLCRNCHRKHLKINDAIRN